MHTPRFYIILSNILLFLFVIHGCKSQKHPKLSVDVGGPLNDNLTLTAPPSALDSTYRAMRITQSFKKENSMIHSSENKVLLKKKKITKSIKRIKRKITKQSAKYDQSTRLNALIKDNKTDDTGDIIAMLLILAAALVLTILVLRAFYPVIGCLGTLLWPIVVFIIIAAALMGLYSLMGGNLF